MVDALTLCHYFIGMSTTPTHITGANVRAEMARKKISQTRLAEHLGISQTSVAARLNGRIAFDINELHTIAAYLDVPLTALLPATTQAGVA